MSNLELPDWPTFGPPGKTNSELDMPRLSKTDARYWTDRVEKRDLPGGMKATDYSVRISHTDNQGETRRERFQLGTPNKAAASRKAHKIFLHLSVNGWEETLVEFKRAKRKKSLVTVGEWIEFARAMSEAKPSTFSDYVSSLRRMMTDIFSIPRPAAKRTAATSPEFQKWSLAVDRIKLADLTTSRLEGWAMDFVKTRSSTPREKEVARTSARSLLAQAKALFSKSIIAKARRHGEMILPDPIPFEGVQLPKVDRARVRYRSTINLPELFESAQSSLDDEEMKVFILAVACGLRRGEIDSLLWRQVDFDQGLIRVERTEFADLKSSSSAGDIPLDLEILAMFRGWRAKAEGEFVIEAGKPRKAVKQRAYRSGKVFKSLIEWLRDHGVTAQKPLHELRKEAGKLMTEEHGIFAASRFLRHADVKTTAAHYAEDSRRLTTGVGKLLRGG